MIINGDCLVEMDKLSTDSIDLVVCDPPYGITSIKWDQVLDFNTLWSIYGRIVKPKGNIILFGSQPFTSLLITSKLDWFRYELIWNKNKCGSPGLAKRRPMKVHENIMIFSQEPGGLYNPIMEEGEPYSRKSKDSSGYVGRKNDHGYGLKPRTEFTNIGTRYPKSIRNVSRDFSAQQQVHPTQKPVSICEWLINTYSNPNDVVLDNCMGSGTTGIACKNTGRQFIGIEKDPDYFKLAQTRINTNVFII
jgi:site-specific DNA-methyltransferase (adenine-specific)